MPPKEEHPCAGCKDEKATVKIKLPDRTIIHLGPKCYAENMKNSTWTVLKKKTEPK